MRLTILLPSILMLAACGATGTVEAPVADQPSPNTAASGGPAAQESDPVPTRASSSQPPIDPGPDAQRYSQDHRGDADAKLPDAIVRALGTDELVLSCRDGTRAGVSQFAADWVGVRRHDLDRDGREDWIVNGAHDCLRTSYAAYWWIYADSAAGPRVLLRAEPAATLEVLPSSTQGFRDLRMHVVNGRGAELVADNRYDGKRYASAPTP